MSRPDPKRTQLTPEAFREIAEAAIAEVYDNSDSMELHDLRTWQGRLKQALVAELTYCEPPGVGDQSAELDG